jgi:hypothetical protein
MPQEKQPRGQGQKQVTNLFQIQLEDMDLTKDQVQKIASAIRNATAAELLKMDFRIEELKPLFGGRAAASNCGGCSTCGA